MKCYNIPIFVPHEGCPFDCIFCNQRKITGSDTSITKSEISKIIKEHLETLPECKRYVEVAFFGGSFTGISKEKQCEFLEEAHKFVESGDVDGIRLSTRPDYISEEILDRLEKYGVTSIELGVQSMDDEVLAASNRGHTEKTVREAVMLIRKYSFRLGLQMMTGLPGDTPRKSIETAHKIIALKPDFVRIYPTLVLEGTGLCRLYESGKYVPQELDEAVQLSSKLLKAFRESNIDVIRISLCTTDEICENGSVVAGPFHSAFGELVESEIYYDKIAELLAENPKVSIIYVNPREVSKAVGNRKKNIIKIKENFGIDLKIKAQESVKKGDVKIWKE